MPDMDYLNPDFGESSRFGFNGKEKDANSEWGDQNHYDYGFRIYNPTIGKFLSTDPLTRDYPWYTPYQFAGNTPIMAIDLDGLEPYVEDGVLIGYVVQKGQGPTQISKDLNDPETQKKYGYNLIKPVRWQNIVYSNMEAFKNVFKGHGEVFDRENIDYHSGNISPNQFLTVPGSYKIPENPVITSDPVKPREDPQFSDSKAYKLLPSVVSAGANITINIPTSIGVGPGLNVGVSYNWITKGKNKSFLPKNFTLNYGVGVGIGVSGNGYVNPQWYTGNPDDLSGAIFNSEKWSDFSISASIFNGQKLDDGYLGGVSIPFAGTGPSAQGIYINWSKELLKIQEDNKKNKDEKIFP
jgi:RHS repeat-associated protein